VSSATAPTIVRFASVQPSRWANGLGETRELALRPARRDLLGADGLSTGSLSADSLSGVGFVWRISIATISGASDFSPLPGVDRKLMNLGDGPLQLSVKGSPRILKPRDVLPFSGEDAVRAEAGNGYDLNVMTDRRLAQSDLQAVSLSGTRLFAGGAATMVALIALDDALSADGSELEPLDCVLGAPGNPVELTGDGTAAWLRITVTA
jgi:hypothetical protein